METKTYLQKKQIVLNDVALNGGSCPQEKYSYNNCDESSKKKGREFLERCLNFKSYEDALNAKEQKLRNSGVSLDFSWQHRNTIWNLEKLIQRVDPELLKLLCCVSPGPKNVKYFSFLLPKRLPEDLLLFRFCCLLQSFELLPPNLRKINKYLICDVMLSFRFLCNKYYNFN
jgi:hypothetical protein